jgi:Rieske Fe-S protein
MSRHDESSPADSCAGCSSLGDRRAFLRDAATAVAGAFLALGVAPAIASAQPLAFISALGANGQVRSYAIPAQDGATIDKENEVILVRWQGSAYAFNLSCPHQNTALRWFAEDARFQCPKHKSKYRPDGSFIEGRATRGMDRFAVKKDAAGIAVDLDKLIQQDEDPSGWAAAAVKL